MLSINPIIPSLDSFGWYAKEYWHLMDKDGNSVPFNLNAGQLITEYETEKQRRARRPERVKVLKTRQCGESTGATGKLGQRVMTRFGHNALSIADKEELPRTWTQKLRNWYMQVPECDRPHASLFSASEIYFDRLESRYFIGSQYGQTPGMGHTIHSLHVSEIATWNDGRFTEIMARLMPAVPYKPGTLVILEGTGEVTGDPWHTSWWVSRRGEDESAAIFLPWFIQADYVLPADDVLEYSEREKQIIQAAECWAKDFPEHAELIGFDGVKKEQIAWRRASIKGDPFYGDSEQFDCKYPNTPEEAFLSAGRNVFTREQVQIARETVREPIWKGDILFRDHTSPYEFSLSPNQSGECFIWEYPNEHLHYVLGADCMWGTRITSSAGGKDRELDYDVLYVQCLETGKVCARVRGRYILRGWANYIAAMGKMYNWAVVAPEVNTKASTELMPVLGGKVADWRYPNIWIRSDDVTLKGYKPVDYGWYTGAKGDMAKGEIVSFAKLHTLDGDFDWADSLCVDEMSAYIWDKHGTQTAPEGMHDDCLMSRMITAFVAHRVIPHTDLYYEPKPQVIAFNDLNSRMRGMDTEDEQD